MAKTLGERLLEKGWAEDEVKKTLGMLYSEGKEEKHMQFRKQSNLITYWATILVLTVSNFVISIVLVPFLLVMKPYQLEIIVAILGFVLGLLFNIIIRDIEHIELKHHVLAAVFIPAVALINVFVMVTISNSLAERLKLQTHENPILISLIYVTAFLLPYIFSQFMELREKMMSRKIKAQ